MLQILFYSALATIVYTYVLYPLLVIVRGYVWRKPYRKEPITPSVTMIIACHNEEAGIEAKLHNVGTLDYPHEHLQVIVAADGCTDRTEEIVRRFVGDGITLLSLPRGGKAPALNAAVKAAEGEILVFSDANSMYAIDSIRQLTQPFADETIGGVAGNQVYRQSTDGATDEAGEQAYWSFDRWLKTAQSRSGNTISATGAIYAIRKSLFKKVPDGVTDDFVTSTRVIEQGYRLVFEPAAICFEPAAKAQQAEFRRKTRIITRGLRGVLQMRSLMNPLRHGLYSWQFLSHKLLRRLVVFPVLVLAVTSPLLWNTGWFFQAATLAQASFYGLALCGLVMSRLQHRVPKPMAIALFFCMVNAAVLVAAWNLLTGRRIDRWDPERVTAGGPLPAPTDVGSVV